MLNLQLILELTYQLVAVFLYFFLFHLKHLKICLFRGVCVCVCVTADGLALLCIQRDLECGLTWFWSLTPLFPPSPHFLASPLLSSLPSSLVISFPFLRLRPAPLPPSSLAAVCSATCEYSITFQTAPCTAQLTEISLFPAPLFCSRGADKREERGLLRGWPFFSFLFFISRQAKARKSISMAQVNNLQARMWNMHTRFLFPLS